jgi:hypothetical protein
MKRSYRLPSGKAKTVWIARYKDDQGELQYAKPDWNGAKSTFDLKKDAQRAIDEALGSERAKRANAKTRERVSTVGDYLPRWLEEHPRSDRTDHTNKHRVTRVLDVRLEGRALRDYDMRDLRRRHGNELVGHMFKDHGRNAGGCHAILRALSAMFEDAITDEFCEINPWKGVKVSQHE